MILKQQCFVWGGHDYYCPFVEIWKGFSQESAEIASVETSYITTARVTAEMAVFKCNIT